MYSFLILFLIVKIKKDKEQTMQYRFKAKRGLLKRNGSSMNIYGINYYINDQLTAFFQVAIIRHLVDEQDIVSVLRRNIEITNFGFTVNNVGFILNDEAKIIFTEAINKVEKTIQRDLNLSNLYTKFVVTEYRNGNYV